MSSQALPAHAKQLFQYLFERVTGNRSGRSRRDALACQPSALLHAGIPGRRTVRHELFPIDNPEDSQDERDLFQQLVQVSLETRFSGNDFNGHLAG
jgi:hypothetical protein